MGWNLSAGVSRVKEAVEEFVFAPPPKVPDLPRWEAPDLPTDTVEQVDAAIHHLDSECTAQHAAWKENLPLWKSLNATSRYGDDVLNGLRTRYEENTRAISAAAHELRNWRQRLVNHNHPVKRFRREHPGATVAEAIADLAAVRAPELNAAVVRFAASYLEMIAASGSLASLLGDVERECGVSLANVRQSPVPAYVDLVASPLHRLPRPEQHHAAAATFVSSLAQRWPAVADDLYCLYDQWSSTTADAPLERAEA